MNLYKTSLCRYFSLQQICPLGENCHYAHGDHELRKASDPIPETLKKKIKKKSAIIKESEPNTSTNFKTVVCKYWLSGKCKFEVGCTFAHGETELRTIVIIFRLFKLSDGKHWRQHRWKNHHSRTLPSGRAEARSLVLNSLQIDHNIAELSFRRL